MKRFHKIVVILALAALFMFISTSCLRDYLMFEDGEFDGIEFSDYDLMHNAEIDMDDVDRN